MDGHVFERNSLAVRWAKVINHVTLLSFLVPVSTGNIATLVMVARDNIQTNELELGPFNVQEEVN